VARSWLASEINAGSTSDNVRLVQSADGSMVLAWEEGNASGSGSRKVHLAHWNGKVWQKQAAAPLGSSSDDSFPLRPVLAVDTQGRPTVAWSEPDSGLQTIHVMRVSP
jgi:hypothetical protein